MGQKVEPGQVWSCLDNKYRVKITRIVGQDVFAEYVGNRPVSGEVPFGTVDEHGAATLHWSRWFYEGTTVERMTYPKATKATEASKTDLDFFRTPATPGHCPCDMPRQQCDYHR